MKTYEVLQRVRHGAIDEFGVHVVRVFERGEMAEFDEVTAAPLLAVGSIRLAAATDRN